MGSKPKAPKPVKPPPPIPSVEEEDETVRASSDLERRRLAAQKGRAASVTSNRSTILG